MVPPLPPRAVGTNCLGLPLSLLQDADPDDVPPLAAEDEPLLAADDEPRKRKARFGNGGVWKHHRWRPDKNTRSMLRRMQREGTPEWAGPDVAGMMQGEKAESLTHRMWALGLAASGAALAVTAVTAVKPRLPPPTWEELLLEFPELEPALTANGCYAGYKAAHAANPHCMRGYVLSQGFGEWARQGRGRTTDPSQPQSPRQHRTGHRAARRGGAWARARSGAATPTAPPSHSPDATRRATVSAASRRWQSKGMRPFPKTV